MLSLGPNSAQGLNFTVKTTQSSFLVCLQQTSITHSPCRAGPKCCPCGHFLPASYADRWILVVLSRCLITAWWIRKRLAGLSGKNSARVHNVLCIYTSEGYAGEEKDLVQLSRRQAPRFFNVLFTAYSKFLIQCPSKGQLSNGC